jgi:sugar phosphate isomerase/epimerase
MAAYSRREFGKALVVGVSIGGVVCARRVAAARQVVLGVTTSSFRDLPRVTGRDNVEDILRAVRAAGARHVELSLSNVEPAPPSTGSFIGGSAAYPRRVVLSSEEIAATNAVAREELRRWRLATPPAHVAQLRRTFEQAGVGLVGAAVTFDASFADDELDAVFTFVKALGIATVSSAMTMATARRLVPFAERHDVRVGIHHQMDNSTGLISAGDLRLALALSPRFAVKLDVGTLAASDRDVVADLRTYQDRVAYVLMRDRLRHGGASQPFGDGDTPLAAIMAVLSAAPSSIPAIVEYDYPGLRPASAELAASLAYLERHA